MKIIVHRNIKDYPHPPDWITLEESDLLKNKWKKYGSKSNYLNQIYPSSWRIILSARNKILTEENVLTLLERSFSNYFTDDILLNDFISQLNTLINPNIRKKDRIDDITTYKQTLVAKSLQNFLDQKLVSSNLENISDFLLTNPDFIYTIPFIDPEIIIFNDNRKEIWEKNSIESFLRHNMHIQVDLKSLEEEGIGIGLFLRKDIKLGKGKTAAQLSHGAVSLLYQSMFKNNFLTEFMKTKEKKILFYTVKDLKVLDQIQKLCIELEINHAYIQDAGHTQIDPGTATVTAVGPIPLIWIRILGFNIEAVQLN